MAPIPFGITRKDVLAALARLDRGEAHPFGLSTRFDLVHEGKCYPPKAVVGLAAERLTGRSLRPADFSGGKDSQCNRILKREGFNIIEKSAVDEAHAVNRDPADGMNSAVYESILRGLGFLRVERSKLLTHAMPVPSLYFNRRRDGFVYFTGYARDRAQYAADLWQAIEPQQEKDKRPELVTLVPAAGRERLALRSLLVPAEDHEAADDLAIQVIDQRTDIGPTEKKTLVNARRGQGVFRSNLEQIETSCRLTGVSELRHLRASHIRPWRVSNDTEKLDGFNGLLLSPHVDHLFDQGYISFEDDGTVLVSRELDRKVLEGWGIRVPRNVGKFRAEQCRYLEYHRKEVFEKK